MPINREGVELLKADMRANAAAYTQDTFGRLDTDCGTVECMAGFCRLRKIGSLAWTQEVARMNYESWRLGDDCIPDGIKQLGLQPLDNEGPQIFEFVDLWPEDLADAYEQASTPAARVEVACAALDRLQEDGSIAELEENNG